jgi:serine/threonine protein kinase
LTRDRELFDAGGLKSVVENRAKERKKTASSGPLANLDHVSGIANQRIVGAYSVFEDYSKEKVVGKGMSGEVWKARLLQNPKWGEPQKDVVLKELKKQGLSDRKFKEILTECEVGLLLDHPLICRLLRVYDSPKSVTLVLEYCNGGDLFDRVSKAGHFIEKDVKVTCIQMLGALNYLRAKHVVHRDIKLENWLYATNDPLSPVCLTDFGLATYFYPEVDPPLNEMMGSLFYIAPEVLRQSYGFECDIWSLGIVCYMLLSGIAPFEGENQEKTIVEILNKTVEFPRKYWNDDVSKEAQDFIMRLLTRDVRKRPSAAAALNHVWLKELKDRRRHAVTDDVRSESMEMLLNLAREPTLRRAFMMCIGKGAQTKTYRDARRQFYNLDLENTGTITEKSFVELSKARGISPDEASQLFQRLDINDHKELSYSAFLAAYFNLELVEDEDAILRAFHIFDVDHDGYVSKTDLEKVFVHHKHRDFERMLEEVGCREPDGMDLRHFKLMLLQQATAPESPKREPPSSPMRSPTKRSQEISDTISAIDLGDGSGELRKGGSLRKIASMANCDLQRSISLLRPAFRASKEEETRTRISKTTFLSPG